MIKEEVEWGFRTRDEAFALANNVLCKEGYEVIVQNIAIGYTSEVVAYLVVERKVEE
jgi:hypothetical protein